MARETRTLITSKTVTYAFVGLLCATLPLFLLTDLYFVPFAVVFAAVFVALVFYSPFVGLLIYSVIYLLRPQEWLSALQAVPMPLERPLALLLLTSVLLRNILKRDLSFRLTRVDSTLLLYISVVLLSVIFAIRVDQSWLEWQDLAKLAILNFVIAAVIRDKEELKLYVLYVVGLTAFYSFWSVKGYYTGMRQYRMGIWRAVGPDTSYGGPNSLGMTLVSTFPLVYYHVRKELPRYIIFGLYAALAIMLWNIILTGSRTAMAGMLFFFVLLVWQSRHRFRNLILSAMALICIWVIMPEQYRERFESTAEVSADEDTGTGAAESASARIDGVKIGFRMVMDRPLFGYGIGNWGFAAGNFYRPGWWAGAHTLIGQILGEIGFVGTAAFILWLWSLFSTISRIQRFYRSRQDEFMSNLALALKSMLILLLVLGLGGHNLFRYSWFLISALTVAQLKIMEQEERQATLEHNHDLLFTESVRT
jgi:probable O-glycosylation ligase (exosortase A-associated)